MGKRKDFINLLRRRVQELEDIICPSFSHDFVLVDYREESEDEACKVYKCKRCNKTVTKIIYLKEDQQ